MLNEILVAIAIVFVCLLLHVAGIMVMAEWLLRHRELVERNGAKTRYSILIIILFSGIMLLHLIETSIWAFFYYTRELFSDFETSLYFSMTSFTTIGYGDVLLPEKWRLLGVIEGVSGVLLCGVSTAFIFAAINAMFQLRIQQRSRAAAETETAP
jgi:voltage-gated potassium channel